MNNQMNITNAQRKYVLLSGIIGIIGALMILISDILYNIPGGNELGPLLFLPAYLGVFCFPFWWGGIWVIYQGENDIPPLDSIVVSIDPDITINGD